MNGALVTAIADLLEPELDQLPGQIWGPPDRGDIEKIALRIALVAASHIAPAEMVAAEATLEATRLRDGIARIGRTAHVQLHRTRGDSYEHCPAYPCRPIARLLKP